MKNKNDIINELNDCDNRIDDLKARITIAQKLGFTIEIDILCRERSILVEMRQHLQDFLKMIDNSNTK